VEEIGKNYEIGENFQFWMGNRNMMWNVLVTWAHIGDVE